MHFERIYKDDPRLDIFVEECKQRNLNNNKSIKDLKFDYFDNQAFFAGIQDNKIKVFSGVHNFDYDNKRYWRLGFRGVTLYDEKFKPITSKNWRRASVNMGVLFYFSIEWVERNFGPSDFIMTSNDYQKSLDGAGSSHQVDKIAKLGFFKGCSLLYENIEYLYTIQNVWALEKKYWYEDFDRFYKDKITVKGDIFKL
jgi:hypothetical protein